MTDFIETLIERGLRDESTDLEALRALSRANAIHLYIGFDLTADSLHVGSLIQMMVARWALATGNRVTILTGSFTTSIGDPTGRTSTRPILTQEQIVINQIGIQNIIQNFLSDVPNHKNLSFQDNVNWLANMTLKQFMLFASNVSGNRLVNLKFVSDRLEAEQPITLGEMLYPVVQGMDFFALFDLGVNLQVGGSDQWANILQGVSMIKKINNREAHALVTPLLTNAAGEKMGKTADGAVWLSANKLHPNEFFQFWRNVEDDRVESFFKMLTDLPLNVIADQMAGDINQAKIALATAITTLVHGTHAAGKAVKNAETLFIRSGTSFEETDAILIDGRATIAEMVAKLTGESVSQAKRLIEQHAVKINDSRIVVNGSDLCSQFGTDEKFMLSVGKKRRFVCKLF